MATSALSANGRADGQLQFMSGGTNPPNPDVIAATNMDVTRTFTLRNVSSGPTSAIAFSLSDGGDVAWVIEPSDGGTGRCAPGGILSAATNCMVSVIFHAGLGGQLAGTFDAGLVATANNGGTATQILVGTAAYTWVDAGVLGAMMATYSLMPPSNPCPSKSMFVYQQNGSSPSGLQYEYWHVPASNSRCTTTDVYYQVPASQDVPASPPHYPGRIRSCSGTAVSPMVSGDHAPQHAGDSYSWFCGPDLGEPSRPTATLASTIRAIRPTSSWSETTVVSSGIVFRC